MLSGSLQPFRLSRNTRGGGAVGYVKNGLLCTLSLGLLEQADVEIVWLEF